MSNPRDDFLRAIFNWSAGWGIAGLAVGGAAICWTWSLSIAGAIFVAGSACGLAFGAYRSDRSFDRDERRRAIRSAIAWGLSSAVAAFLLWNWRWLDAAGLLPQTLFSGSPTATLVTHYANGSTSSSNSHMGGGGAYQALLVPAGLLLGGLGGFLSTMVAARPRWRPPLDALMTGAGWAAGCAAGASIFVVTAYMAVVIVSPLAAMLQLVVGRTVAGAIAGLFVTGIGGLASGALAATIGVPIERFAGKHIGESAST